MRLPELQLTPDGWDMQFATNHRWTLLRGLHEAPVLNADPDATFGVAAHAVDPATAARLWEIFRARPRWRHTHRAGFAKGLTVHSGD